MPSFKERVLEHWNNRATLGEAAGTDDEIAKRLEIEAIASHVRDGMNVLDIGCGNGITAVELAKRHAIHLKAVDFASEMITAAKRLAESQTLKGDLAFGTGDIEALPDFTERFDLVYTERVLINLPDWEAQKEGIRAATSLLAIGGLYVMCENSHEGLERINALRERANLAAIVPPWHNRYIRDSEIQDLTLPGVRLEGVQDYSSTYYFLSRVVNAYLAEREGTKPRLDAPVNQLALHLPPFGNCGQGRLWLWRREGA